MYLPIYWISYWEQVNAKFTIIININKVLKILFEKDNIVLLFNPYIMLNLNVNIFYFLQYFYYTGYIKKNK